MRRWAIEWRCADPEGSTHFMTTAGIEPGDPRYVLFVTRHEARNWIKKHFSYIRHRKDLYHAPLYWRMPLPVRVSVNLERLTEEGAGRAHDHRGL